MLNVLIIRGLSMMFVFSRAIFVPFGVFFRVWMSVLASGESFWNVNVAFFKVWLSVTVTWSSLIFSAS